MPTKPDLARLREFLFYDPQTGELTWRKKPNRRIRVGSVAGCRSTNEYVMLRFDGQFYRAHQLIWFMETGEWPNQEIDHRDLDGQNNQWGNLREATPTQNRANMGAHRDNRCGLKGVSLNHGKWVASIQSRGVTQRLGRFTCPAAAHFAYIVAADQTFGEFARAA